MTMNANMLAGIREAMALLHQEGPGAATVKIQQTLRGLMPTGTWPGTADTPRDSVPTPLGRADTTGLIHGLVPDLLARLGLDRPLDGGRHGRRAEVSDGAAQTDGQVPAPGEFLAGSFTNTAGTRAYKLYVPTAYQGQPLPLVVMLHGCTQTPDDFAVGTRWNAIAEEQPCLVLYPAQAQSANATRCWNWFNAPDQQRDQGEPSLIAGMTREIIERYHVDPTQVYIAGLSAGGAMAVVMGTTYPELYAALGIHSGLPYAAAQDLPSALAAMQGGGTPVAGTAPQGMPIIVFHGDRDQTVHPRNSDDIMTQSLPRQTVAQTQTVPAATGHAYTRTVHAAPDGTVVAEQWLVHGAGHAWCGGSRRGSFTDGKGPDASREMMRFFAAQSQPMARGPGVDTNPDAVR